MLASFCRYALGNFIGFGALSGGACVTASTALPGVPEQGSAKCSREACVSRVITSASTPSSSAVSNLSNAPEQQYFAGGITEDVTTDLSRLAGVLVISCNTAFT